MAEDGEKLPMTPSANNKSGSDKSSGNRNVSDNRPPVGTGCAPIIVLVAPQLGENIGAAARAMLNFGLTGLRLVSPRDGWPNARAGAMAAGAARVLDSAQVHDALPDAIADCHYVLATTARHRDMALPVVTPPEAAQSLQLKIMGGARTAIIFGGERSGLSSDDIAKSHGIVTVPVNPDFSSLNLAQAVLLMAYEWSKVAPPDREQGSSHSGRDAERRLAPAPAQDQAALMRHLFEALDGGGFFHPPEKTRLMQRNIEVMLTRARFTEHEARTFRGMIKALSRGRGRRPL